MANGWQISGGTENNSYVGIFGNSGEITISKNGLCGSVPQVNYNCDGTESGCCSGDSTYEYNFELNDFDGNIVGSPFVQTSTTITSCNREMFVAWYRDDEHNSIGTIRVLDDIRPVDSKRSRTFMMKNVDECEQIITTKFYEIPYFISGSGATRPIIPFAQSQEFSTSGYVDSGYPPIAKYPCDGSNHEIKYISGTEYSGHKIKYMPINKNIPCDNNYTYGGGTCIVNNPYLVELYFPHNYTGIDTAHTTVNIGEGSFSGNTNLTAVTFSKVQNINDYAFSGCTNLTNIDWGHKPCGISGDNRVTRSIGIGAFMDCNVPCLNLPNSITRIWSSAFTNCNVSKLHLPENNGYWIIDDNIFANCTSLSSVTIPDNVTLIALRAFKGCTNLSDVRLSVKLEHIQMEAFDGCSSLPVTGGVTYAGEADTSGGLYYLCAVSSDKTSSAYTLDSHTRFIHSNAFSGNPNLVQINLANTSVREIGFRAFYKCTSLSSVTFPSSTLIDIDNAAFWECSGLTNINIPNYVENIGGSAFKDCTSLSSCTIGSSVRKIDTDVFEGCNALSSITFSSSTHPELSEYGNVFPTGEGKAFNKIIVPNSSAVTDYTQAWSGRTDMQGVTISTS